MSTIVVNLDVPIVGSVPNIAGVLHFARWLPLGEEDAIWIPDDGLDVKLWFNIDATRWAIQIPEEEIPRYIAVPAHRIQVDLTIRDVRTELLEYMATRDFGRAPSEEGASIQSEYQTLGTRVLDATLPHLNRLLAYARALKGHYWIAEYAIDYDRMGSFFQQVNAKAKDESGRRFRFQPTTGDRFVITVDSENDKRLITREEWEQVRAFVTGRRRPPIIDSLLANAEELRAKGHRRSALIEAITALEMAVSDFVRAPDAQRAFGAVLAERLSVDSLGAQYDHLGFSGTIRYLLPSIIPDSVVPTDVFRACQLAIDERHNVVHNAQRDVSEVKLRRALRGVRRLVQILRRVTAETREGTPPLAAGRTT
jgi:hypothetical protein